MSKKIKLPTLYSTREVAEMFQVTTETVRNWIKDKKIQAVMVNGRYRIPRDAALALAQFKYGDEEAAS